MAKFIVRQQRPFWATCTQLIDAETPEEAMKAFNPSSPDTSKIIGEEVTGPATGPLSAFDADERWSDTFPVEDWQEEVSNGDTMLGYREWLAVRSEILDED